MSFISTGLFCSHSHQKAIGNSIQNKELKYIEAFPTDFTTISNKGETEREKERNREGRDIFCTYSSLLLQRKPPMVVDDLFEDMKDGVKLLALLEVLSGQKLVRIFLCYHTCQIVFIWNLETVELRVLRCAAHPKESYLLWWVVYWKHWSACTSTSRCKEYISLLVLANP